MKKGFSLMEILHRENPVLITERGLQCTIRSYAHVFCHSESDTNSVISLYKVVGPGNKLKINKRMAFTYSEVQSMLKKGSPPSSRILRRGHVSYFFVTVIVIVAVIMISAMFIFQYFPKLHDKHCLKHYDCDYDYDCDKKIRYNAPPIVTVIVLYAIFILQLWTVLKDKHC